MNIRKISLLVFIIFGLFCVSITFSNLESIDAAPIVNIDKSKVVPHFNNPDRKYDDSIKNATRVKYLRDIAIDNYESTNLQSGVVIGDHIYYGQKKGDQTRIVKQNLVTWNIKRGPWFDIGSHGNGLSYNPKDKKLYLLRDNNENLTIYEISQSTLTHSLVYKKSGLKGFFELTFDNNGVAYFWNDDRGVYTIDSGNRSISESGYNPSPSLLFTFNNQPVGLKQDITFYNNALYFTGENQIVKVALSNYQVTNFYLQTSLEFEGLTFYGNIPYLIVQGDKVVNQIKIIIPSLFRVNNLN